MTLNNSPMKPTIDQRDIRTDTRLVRFIESGDPCLKECCFIGPAGSGKTMGILTVLHILAREYQNLRILFCRDTRSSLTESVLVSFEQEVLVNDSCTAIAHNNIRRTRQSYKYPSKSEIIVAGLDNATRVLSTAWDIIFVNELVECTEEMFENLLGRLNRPGRDPRFGWCICDTNPSVPSHWLKRRIDSGKTVAIESTHKANPALWDGKNWTDIGNSYIERLSKLTGNRRERLLKGLWSVGAGLWFHMFDRSRHVADEAEYNPEHKVHLAVDSGVCTAGVFFQIREYGGQKHCNVFAEYFSEDVPSYACAQQLLIVAKERCDGRLDRCTTDPAGGSRNPIGPKCIDEYKRGGLHLDRWPRVGLGDSLSLVEGYIADGRLTIHSRCTGLINAFESYMRAKKDNMYLDVPVDPAHPEEDFCDAIRGGLCSVDNQQAFLGGAAEIRARINAKKIQELGLQLQHTQ